MITEFTPFSSLIGGVLIGLGAVILMAFNGRIAGMTAMLGGVLWATGNVLTVPIVKTVGLSLGLLTWGMTNMVIGWASARFGVLGVFESNISNKSLNMVSEWTSH
jgi:hypothetical protein